MKKSKKKKAQSKSWIPGKKKLSNIIIPLVLAFGAFIYEKVPSNHFSEWLEKTPQKIANRSENGTIELFANQTHDDLRDLFLDRINSAKHSISFVIYSLTDPHIIAALNKKAKEGVNIKLVCDAKASPHIDSKLSNIDIIRRFGPGLMHQKMVVIDEKTSLIGSANMTNDSLKMHGNLVTEIEDSHFAKEVIEKTKAMPKEGFSQSFPFKIFQIGAQTVELWFLPDNKLAIARLKDLIKTAQKTLRVAMFTWTRQDLAQEVIAAKSGGT